MLLNDLLCKNAKSKSKPYKLNDGDGLWFFVNPNGKKYWRCDYKYHEKENRLSFGSYPKISLANARKKREKLKADLEEGNDPSLLRREQKQSNSYDAAQTFQALSIEWHSKNTSNWSSKTAARILRRLKNELFPDLGRYPIKKLPRKVFIACLQKAASRSPELGKRLLGYSKQIFEFAGLTDRLDKDLTIGVKAALPKYSSEHYACIELEELPDLIKAIYAAPPEKSKLANRATRLLMLFGCRTMELMRAERREFNLANAMWIIPSDRMKKSGEHKKIKREHLVPLSNQAIGILLELDKEYGAERKYLLPSTVKSDRPVSKMFILQELKRIGYQFVMTGHGFRTLLMTVSTEKLKFPAKIADRQLAHVPKGELMRIYNRAKYLSRRVRLMQDYADYLEKQLPNHPTQRSNNAAKTNNANIGEITTPFNGYGYSARIGYQSSSFAKTLESRLISEATQRHRQSDQSLVESRDHSTLQ